jgi:putative oxidoreductase
MTTIIDGMLALRRLILAIAGALSWAGPTLARLTVGWLFVVSGWGKLHNLEQVINYFGELGIPHPELQAPFASGTELVCGTLVLIGLCTRVAGVPLIITMIVAIVTAQHDNVHGLADLFGLIEWCYIALLVWLGVAGPGPLSVDALLVRWATQREPRAGRTPVRVASAANVH